MGREIAKTTGPETLSWQERPARAEQQRPDLLVKNLELEPDQVIADIGAGSGYFSFRLAPRVPEGKVLAVDIDPGWLEIIEKKKVEKGVENVVTVLGTLTDPRLPPESVDVVLMVDVYHEFSHPLEMMQGIIKALKPGGRVVQVEYRLEDPEVKVMKIHKMSEAQARKEMEAVDLEWRETKQNLPQQHFLVYTKKP